MFRYSFGLSYFTFYFITLLSFAQVKNKGIPFTTNYTQKDYNAYSQNWCVVQDKRGIMYFGNNDGILEFDGKYWKLEGLPNKTIVRSLALDHQGRIYVGGQGDFGYLRPALNGSLKYASLKDLIPSEYQNFDDVWRIHITGEGVFFNTFKAVYQLVDDEIKVIHPYSRFGFNALANGTLYNLDSEQGLVVFKNGGFEPAPHGTRLKGKIIQVILPYDEQRLLIATLKDGLFLYDDEKGIEPFGTGLRSFLSRSRIYCGTKLSNGNFALGTSHEGVVIVDKSGNAVQHINREKGINNNTVLSIFQDKLNNLWVGLDNGIAYVEISSPFTQFNSQTGLHGTVYSSIFYENKILLGTNNGVYFKEWDKLDNPFDRLGFDLYEETKGQVWDLSLINGQLFMGHHDGGFSFYKNGLTNLSEQLQGFWRFLQLKNYPNHLIAGTYSGLVLLENKKGKWSFVKKLKGLDESSRVMEEDNEGNIWMTHGYKGVYKIKLSKALDNIEDVRFYNSAKGLPSDFHINVAKIKDEIVFTTPKGVYKYDKQADLFVEDDKFTKIFGNKPIRKLIEDKKGNVWFAINDDLGVLKLQSDGTYMQETTLFKKLSGVLVGGFEHIFNYDDANVIIGSKDGFIHYNPQILKNYQSPFDALIRRVETTGLKDSVVFGGSFFDSSFNLLDFQDSAGIATFPYDHNALRFTFSSNFFEDHEKIQYKTFLEGYDKGWTPMSFQNQREFTNLREGAYTFHVKATNVYNVESSGAFYSFIILPPWYRTSWAYILYSLLLCFGILGLIGYINRRIKRERIRLQKRQERALKYKEALLKEEVLNAEKEIIRLKNEKLEADLLHKDKELSSSAMHIMQRNEAIFKAKEKLEKILGIVDAEAATHIRKVIRSIEEEIQFENNWDNFELHFNQIHEDFLKRLWKEFPDLNHKDIKLCAYLRLNLSSKEIAPLLGLSIRGVEASRYRLRKKMKLSQDENLTDFILRF